MDFKINRINEVPNIENQKQVEKVQDDTFKFTLISKIDESSLREKLAVMIGEIEKISHVVTGFFSVGILSD